MPTTVTTPAPTPRALERLPGGDVAAALLELTKPRLSGLVVVTAMAGTALAGSTDPLLYLWVALGTFLCSGAASAMNQLLEAGTDARMSRTATRPIPSGRLPGWVAASWAILLLAAGGSLLCELGSPLASGLAMLVAVLYVLVYTPLKQRTPSCTLVGAVCGAIPPLIGWSAVTGDLTPPASVLFGILFVWQIPHFLAIDWFHREDYARGGHRMLSHLDPTGGLTARQSVLWAQALVPVSLLAVPLGLAGWLYAVGALALGVWFLRRALRMARERSREAARSLFLTSLVYLPALLLLLVGDPTG